MRQNRIRVAMASAMICYAVAAGQAQNAANGNAGPSPGVPAPTSLAIPRPVIPAPIATTATPTSLAIPGPAVTAQTGTSQGGTSQAGPSQVGTSQGGAALPDKAQTATSLALPRQVAAAQIGAPPQGGPAPGGPAPGGPAPGGPAPGGPALSGPAPTGPTPIGPAQTPTPLALTPPVMVPPNATQGGNTATATAPSAAASPSGTQAAAPQPATTAAPVVHHRMTPAEIAAKGILLTTKQHPTWGRVSFVLRGNPAPDVRTVPDGVEVHLPPGVHLEVSSAELRETGSIAVRNDAGSAVALIHAPCHCTPEQASDHGVLHLDFHPAPAAASQPEPPPTAVAKDAAQKEANARTGPEAGTPGGAKPEPPAKPGNEAKIPDTARPDPGSKADTGKAEAKTDTGAKAPSTGKAGPAVTQEAAAKPGAEVKADGPPKTVATGRPNEAEEMARLRAFLTEKLAKLNANPPQVASSAGSLRSDAAASRPVAASGAAAKQPAQVGASQGGGASQEGVASQAAAGSNSGAPTKEERAENQGTVCLPQVDASGWRGPGSFTDRLVTLRFQAARSRFAAEDVAALAEFYLANGLGHEALATAGEALNREISPETRLRLTRDADIGSLIKGAPLMADSPLLSNPVDCKRADAALWRDLAAAASGDAEGAARDPETAAFALRSLPGPLQQELAFRIVAAVGDHVDALRAMAGAMRNATVKLPEDEARRFLLQARIAGLTGDQAEYAVFLERAARFDMTPPGIIAKARLAAVRAAEGGPAAAHDEAVLIDIARTYRHDVLGQQSAEQFAELRLRQHDYATALAMADESAGPRGPQPRESRGASLVLRILRMLLVDPATAALPEPNERIALFLRYGGYATPGEKGDDIRFAAARLMLAQNLPGAALDTLRQLSDTSAATPEASEMLATAEAFGGDPAKAMELVKALPDDMAAHRIAAQGLRRMRQPLQAAHVLDGATTIADRERRAGLLFEAEAWPEATAAYADLLHDPLLPAARRDDLATRYALAVAMNGSPENVTGMKLPDAAARVLAVVPPSSSADNQKKAGLSALRGALERARHIETLLDPPTAHQGS